MTRRTTIERILRDEDDASGQTVRAWRLRRDGSFIQIGRDEDSDWFCIRPEDAAQLAADLLEIAGGPE